MKDPKSISLSDHLCFNLYVASRLIVQAYGEELRHLGLTYPKYLVLLALDQTNGQTVGELGERLSLDSGTLSPLLKSLSKQGYVERKRLENDERTVRNFLTQDGRKACAKAKTLAVNLFLETGLSETEFLNIRHSMEDFVCRCKGILKSRKQISLSPPHPKTLNNQRSPNVTT